MKWEKRSLESMCAAVCSGGTPSTRNESYYEGDIPWLRTQEVNWSRIAETEKHISEDGLKNSAAKWVPENSVIVAMYGASAGRVAINSIPLTTNQACCNLIVDPEQADYRYIYYRLLMDYEVLHRMARGAAQDNLNAGHLKGYEIPAPLKREQEAIGSILSAYDDLIENNLRRIKLLEESVRLMYREWFVRLRFPGHEHTRIIDGVPEGWDKCKLVDVLELKYGKSLKAADRSGGAVPVYGSSGIVGTHSTLLVKGPGIVVGRKGNVGTLYWEPGDFWPIDTVYYVGSPTLDYYLYHNLCDQGFVSSHGAVPGLNRNFAYSLPILLPTNSLRREFQSSVQPVFEQITTLGEMNSGSSAESVGEF